MLRTPSPTRAFLLAACLVSACAAADPADVPGPMSRPLDESAGQYLVGRFALARRICRPRPTTS